METSDLLLTTLARIPPNNKITLKVPGTQTRLQFVSYKALLSQTETDLCIIEALGDIFHTVVKNKQDGFLPLNVYLQSYGEVIIRMDDFVPPTQRLTYGIVTSTFRGLALFFSLYGYFEVDIEIYDGKWGHVGTGAVGGGSATSR